MNKRKYKYVAKLSSKLSRLPADERDAAVQYYSEIIDDMMLDERRDWDYIVSRIGTPTEAAKKVQNEQNTPCAIVMKTTKGKGVSFMEDNCDWHGAAPNEEQYNQAMQELNNALAEMEI